MLCGKHPGYGDHDEDANALLLPVALVLYDPSVGCAISSQRPVYDTGNLRSSHHSNMIMRFGQKIERVGVLASFPSGGWIYLVFARVLQCFRNISRRFSLTHPGGLCYHPVSQSESVILVQHGTTLL